MSKYNRLWEHFADLDCDSLTLTYGDIEHLGGVPLDHSFLSAKKELEAYGWKVGKISMKNQTVSFARTK